METRIVLVTAPNEESAADLARMAVESRLAACVNIVTTLRSIYRWEGKIQDEKECLLIIKTCQEKLYALEEAIITNHPYSTPEFVALDTFHVTEKYRKWLESSLIA